jgi:hypothetical protein
VNFFCGARNAFVTTGTIYSICCDAIGFWLWLLITMWALSHVETVDASVSCPLDLPRDLQQAPRQPTCNIRTWNSKPFLVICGISQISY